MVDFRNLMSGKSNLFKTLNNTAALSGDIYRESAAEKHGAPGYDYDAEEDEDYDEEQDLYSDY